MRSKISDDTRSAIAELLKTTDLTNKEIAFKVGVSPSMVSKLNCELGIRPTKSYVTEKMRRLGLRECDAGEHRVPVAKEKKGKLPVRQRCVMRIDNSEIIKKRLSKYD